MKEREKIEALKHEITKTKKLLDGLVNAEVWAIKDWVDATMTLAMKIGKERWPKVVKFCKKFIDVLERFSEFPPEVGLTALAELRGGE